MSQTDQKFHPTLKVKALVFLIILLSVMRFFKLLLEISHYNISVFCDKVNPIAYESHYYEYYCVYISIKFNLICWAVAIPIYFSILNWLKNHIRAVEEPKNDKHSRGKWRKE